MKRHHTALLMYSNPYLCVLYFSLYLECDKGLSTSSVLLIISCPQNIYIYICNAHTLITRKYKCLCFM